MIVSERKQQILSSSSFSCPQWAAPVSSNCRDEDTDMDIDDSEGGKAYEEDAVCFANDKENHEKQVNFMNKRKLFK